MWGFDAGRSEVGTEWVDGLSVFALSTDEWYRARSSNIEAANIVLLGLDFGCCGATLGLGAGEVGVFDPRVGNSVGEAGGSALLF